MAILIGAAFRRCATKFGERFIKIFEALLSFLKLYEALKSLESSLFPEFLEFGRAV